MEEVVLAVVEKVLAAVEEVVLVEEEEVWAAVEVGRILTYQVDFEI